jgi:hypothetical protein
MLLVGPGRSIRCPQLRKVIWPNEWCTPLPSAARRREGEGPMSAGDRRRDWAKVIADLAPGSSHHHDFRSGAGFGATVSANGSHAERRSVTALRRSPAALSSRRRLELTDRHRAERQADPAGSSRSSWRRASSATERCWWVRTVRRSPCAGGDQQRTEVAPAVQRGAQDGVPGPSADGPRRVGRSPADARSVDPGQRATGPQAPFLPRRRTATVAGWRSFRSAICATA